MRIDCTFNLSAIEEGEIAQMVDDLPHGSGINYDWFVDVTRQRIYAYNHYDAMDEMGGYCHVYDVKLTFDRKTRKLLDVHMSGKELSCCGYGLRDYLDDLFFMA